MKKTNPIKKLQLVTTTIKSLQDKLTDDQLKQVGGGSGCAGTVPTTKGG